MRKALILAGLILGATACTNQQIDACLAERPVEQFPWLKKVKESFNCDHCAHAIVKATYKGQTVFYYELGGAYCNVVFRIDLRNCQGDTIKTYFPQNREEWGVQTRAFQNEVTNRQTLYQCGF